MSIKIIDELAPHGAGTFPLLDDQHLRGGFRIVADHAARDAIPADHRTGKSGMFVVTQNDGKKWQLDSNLTTWTEFTGGGGGSSVAGTDGEGSLVEDHETTTGFVLDYESPRAMVSDGTHLYIGQSTQGISTNAQGVLYRLTLTGGLVDTMDKLDLFALCGGNQVRDLAQDATYLYAAMWNNGNVAIIDKASFTVVGWFFLPNAVSAQSICADGGGHFFVLDPSNSNIIKVVTSTCLGASPNVPYGGLVPICSISGSWIRYGAGSIWVTNGNSAVNNALTKVDATTLTVTTSAANVGGDTKAMIAVYDSDNNYVWVAMNSNPAHIYRVDPTTLAVIGSAITPDHPTSSNFGTPVTLEFGPNTTGGVGSYLYVASMSGKNAYPYFGAIDLNTFAWQGSHSVQTNAQDGYEGIAVLGNFVYFGRFDTGGLNITTGVDFYNPVTSSQGTIAAPAPVTTWGLRFTTIGGDLAGPMASAAVVRLLGTAIDPALSTQVSAGYVLTWDAVLGWQARAAAAPAGFTAGGDLTGTSSSQTVQGLQGNVVNNSVPSADQLLTWDVTFGWMPKNPAAVSVISGVTVGGTAAAGKVLTASGPLAADWQTPSAGGGGMPGQAPLVNPALLLFSANPGNGAGASLGGTSGSSLLLKSTSAFGGSPFAKNAGFYRAKGAGARSITACFRASLVDQGSATAQGSAGLYFADSATGRIVTFHLFRSDQAGCTLGWSWYAAPTTYNNDANPKQFAPAGGLYWLRMVDNGTTMHAYYSVNGYDWDEFTISGVSATTQAYLSLASGGAQAGGDRMGLFTSPQQAGVIAEILSYAEGT